MGRLDRLLFLAALLAGCSTPLAVEDPLGALADPALSPRKHLGAMEALDQQGHDDEAYLSVLHGLLWKPGYVIRTREQALERLAVRDPDGLQRTIRQQLPRMGARAWQERLCQIIVERGWIEQTPALVSAWSQRVGFVDDLERAEYFALRSLYGEGEVIDVVFEVMLAAAKPYQQGLRSRAWELLLRLGQDERLRELLAQRAGDANDAMLADLGAAALELGIMPRTREEILWVRSLREPSRAEFWSRAAAVIAGQDASWAADKELRDLPVLVAASLHEPALLAASRDDLYHSVAETLRGRRHHIDPDRFQGFPGIYGQKLHDHRAALTWGDLAAMSLALRAVAVPEVAYHLFDYAERDRADRSCEYGGVIALDERGRFEVLEFPPRMRRHDNEFIASQAMLDVGYTALFHFHNHAQKHRNVKHAGPGLGDVNYADSMRANCLVFTFVHKDTLNVDFYRYGRVIVDLGEVRRP